MTTAREIMTGGAECIGKNETLSEASRRLCDLNIGSMLICGEDRRRKGMLTDRDIDVGCIAQGDDPSKMKTGELARSKPVTIGADDDVSEALATMKQHRVRLLPVIDGHDLIGMLTQTDVIRSLPDDRIGDLVETSANQVPFAAKPPIRDPTESKENHQADSRHVKDKDGADIGKVSELLIDETQRKVRFIEIAAGGFLDIGQDKTFIPIDAVISIIYDEVRIDQTRERLTHAPTYDPDLVRERDTYSEFLIRYGYEPFWGSDYRYLDYPNYRH